MDIFGKVKIGSVKTKRLYMSIASKMFAVFVCLLTFFFYSTNIFQHQYIQFDYDTNSGVTSVIELTGYDAITYPFFKNFAFFFILIVMIISLLIAIFISTQIYFGVEFNALNMMMLALQVIAMEFIISIFSLGGYLLLALYVIDFVQYYIFLGRHKELDIWIFASMILLIICIFPSALALSLLFV
ncbi:MAG: hypothetical protein WCR63_02855 [Bacilli bacterium]